MRKEVIFEVERHSPTPYPDIKNWNEDIVETAGFVPLEVRFKQMEQAGFRAQFFESEFSSKDVRDMYLNHPEFDITAEDDIEEAIEKMELRSAWIKQVKAEAKSRAEKAEKAGTEQPKNKTEKVNKSDEE